MRPATILLPQGGPLALLDAMLNLRKSNLIRKLEDGCNLELNFTNIINLSFGSQSSMSIFMYAFKRVSVYKI